MNRISKRMVKANDDLHNEVFKRFTELKNKIERTNVLTLNVTDSTKDSHIYVVGEIEFSNKLSNIIDIENHPINLSKNIINLIKSTFSDLDNIKLDFNNTQTIFWVMEKLF